MDGRREEYWILTWDDADGSGRGLLSNVKVAIHTAATVSVRSHNMHFVAAESRFAIVNFTGSCKFNSR